MRSLSDTLARLAALKAKGNSGGQGSSGIALETLTAFGSNPGALQARTYVPANLAPGAPLVVVLHGCTQTAAQYNEGAGWSDLADRQGFALLFPEQQRSNNANLCFNWFVANDIERDAGEALSIRQMIETVVAAHGLDRRRIFITGLSAGGAMASVMLAAYPDIFAGGAIIAGLPYGTATTMPEAFDRMRGHGLPGEMQLQKRVRAASAHRGPWPRISVWHGTADHTVDVSNMQAVVQQWTGLHGLETRNSISSQDVGGHVRKVWRDASGEELIEAYEISGMGHGTPLATGGKDGCGKVGPFMLEAGISSTLQIAEFWDLAAAPHAHRNDAAKSKSDDYVHTGEILRPGAMIGAQESERAQQRQQSTATPEATGVGKIIEDALRAAGLMK